MSPAALPRWGVMLPSFDPYIMAYIDRERYIDQAHYDRVFKGVAGIIERSAFVGHALPGIVVALSLVFFTVRFMNPLYQRLPVLIFAYVVHFGAQSMRAAQVAVGGVPTPSSPIIPHP